MNTIKELSYLCLTQRTTTHSTKKNNKKWFNSNIKIALNEKRKLFYKKQASKGSTKAKLSSEYNKKAKLFKDLIKQSIESYELNS